jgi:hypothetical protein
MAIWYILLPFCIFFCNLVNFLVIWYISPRLGILYQEKSGKPDLDSGIVSICSIGSRAFYASALKQGCQIFLGTEYQNGKNILN